MAITTKGRYHQRPLSIMAFTLIQPYTRIVRNGIARMTFQIVTMGSGQDRKY